MYPPLYDYMKPDKQLLEDAKVWLAADLKLKKRIPGWEHVEERAKELIEKGKN
jgi:hypothetical protein